jgi:lysophospholipase L1-like esterase
MMPMPHILYRSLAAWWLMVVLASAPAALAEDFEVPLRLVLVGDSTVCAYPTKSPTHGWGEFIQGRMRRRVEIVNLARGGASTRSYWKEGWWDAALREKPAMVLIQFGHNDQSMKIDPTEYQLNLLRLIESARAAGATPILVTPMQIRVFDHRGRFVPSLTPYAAAMKQVAAEKGVPLIDLHNLSSQLYARLGPAGSAQLANLPGDTVHFNKLGAQAMAELVLRELPAADPRLRREVVTLAPPAQVVPGPPKPKKPPRPARS